jgi:putative CRISPR-associated protein (TIGR02619 family)
MKQRLFVSTCGISMFSNQVRDQPVAFPKGKHLNDYANDNELPADVQSTLDKLSETILQQLKAGPSSKLRKLSAELNALWGYKMDPHNDSHIFLATDTFLGRKVGELLTNYMLEQGYRASNHVCEGLQTQDFASYQQSIKKLIGWCHDTFPGYRSAKTEIIFNLTGSFKALLGYMTVIGMFHADKMIHIFETSDRVLEIPKLPIHLDYTALTQHAPLFARMAEAWFPPIEQLREVDALMWDTIDSQFATLSPWGHLMWEQMKDKILANELLTFPYLVPSASFRKDFESAEPSMRIQLQETLARVSTLLEENQGNPAALKNDGGIQYSDFQNKRENNSPIGHFRMGRGDRVSCTYENKTLFLRHFGHHDYVNNNP